MKKPLQLPKTVTKGLTKNQLSALYKNAKSLASSEDETVKKSALKSIEFILDYISK